MEYVVIEATNKDHLVRRPETFGPQAAFKLVRLESSA